MIKENGGKPTQQNIVFLSDQPLQADMEQDIRFGHRSIVNNIEKIISSCPTPFTIGLFGKWGTGKTTILDALKRKLYATDTAVVKIDAWKHEGDALRRTFLQDTVNQLTKKQGTKQYLRNNYKLSENLKIPITVSYEHEIKFNWLTCLPLLIILALVTISALLLFILSPDNLGTYLSTLVGGGILAAIFTWWLQKFMITETISKTQEIFKDPHQFETEFIKIIKETDSKRLLIIIDNLDRVSCDKAVELLSTIKTYLEQEGCIFLIACDAEAIKKHIENQYNQIIDGEYSNLSVTGDEFLRKFFNSTLVIPEFIDIELHKYTEELLKKTNLESTEIPDISYVISKAFRDNPRQIKQFLNTYLSHLLLAIERENNGELMPGAITGNLTYLAKDLVLRIKYPKYYYSEFSIEENKDNELDDFLRSTQSIKIRDNKAFRYLKLSEIEVEIPETKELQMALQDNSSEVVTEIITKLVTDITKLKGINQIISSLISRNKHSKIILLNIVESCLVATTKLKLELGKFVYFEIADILSSNEISGNDLMTFDPKLIFDEILVRCVEEDRQQIIQKYSSIFASSVNIQSKEWEDFCQSLLSEFIKHKNWLGNEIISQIGVAITSRFSSYKYLSLFIGKSTDNKALIKEETISNFITSISENEVASSEKLKNIVNLLIDFSSLINSNLLLKIINQFASLIASMVPKADSEIKLVLLDCTYTVLSEFYNKIVNLEINIRNSLAQQIISGVNAAGPLSQKRIFIPACILLSDLTNGPIQNQINTTITNFFNTTNTEDTSFVINRFKTKENKGNLLTKYKGIFNNRIISEASLFEFLYPLASEDIRTEWLKNLIQVNPQLAITKLEQLNYRVDNKKEVVSAILTRAEQIQPITQRENLYKVCNIMKCANDTELKERFIRYIKIHLKDGNHDTQKVGLIMLQGTDYLSQTQRRDITTETVDWLSTLQPNNIYQPSSIKSPLVTWQDLTKPLQQKYLDIVFSKLIIRGIDSKNIDLGFEILNSIQPKPEYSESDNSKYYDDILVRILNPNEPNKEIKLHLLNGLKNLQPTKLSKDNKGYWEKVKTVPIQ
jgi:hypothetical protein